MIYSISSDLPKFKTLKFHHGLNVLVVDREQEATDQQTRNRAGKSSLTEIIHFLFGSSTTRGGALFKSDALKDSLFTAEFDLCGHSASVKRRGVEQNRVYVDSGVMDNWPVHPSLDTRSHDSYVSLNDWRLILGNQMFKLPVEQDRSGKDKWAPSLRTLFPYFVRRQSEEAFVIPERSSYKQETGSQQINVSYLLGLDWTIPQQLQWLRDQNKSLRELKKAAGAGALEDIIGTSASLRSRLAVADKRAAKLRDDLAAFRVLDEYSDLEAEASAITQELGRLADANTLDIELINDLENSLTTETPPPLDDLLALYSEASIILPDAVVQQFEAVREFHKSVIENRRHYLSAEIEEGKNRISERERVSKEKEKRYSQIMSILKSHGALDNFVSLQSELSKMEAEAEILRRRFDAAQQLEGKQAELDIEYKKLHLRLIQDFQERYHIMNDAILAFEETSKALYGDNAGHFSIEPTEKGPQFDIDIHGESSTGVSHMQIFCFDMMLMQVCSARGIGPGFLVHDSHLFDGVDVRQIATALRVGQLTAEQYEFQYIVSLNSDTIAAMEPGDFDISKYELPMRLTDATEDGGLFGFRFDI